MTTYYLYDSGLKAENRMVLTPNSRDGEHEILANVIEADSWLDAKARLGFDLTAAQKWLLDEQKRRAA